MRFILLLLFIFIIGCSNTMPKVLEVPIAVQPPSPIVQPKPHLPIEGLRAGAKSDETIKAYVQSVKILQDDDKELRTLLTGYQK